MKSGTRVREGEEEGSSGGMEEWRSWGGGEDIVFLPIPPLGAIAWRSFLGLGKSEGDVPFVSVKRYCADSQQSASQAQHTHTHRERERRSLSETHR